jgi:FlaA1/EpsC-like NDP-sugar epimerase
VLVDKSFIEERLDCRGLELHNISFLITDWENQRNFSKEISNRGFTRAKPMDSKSISKQLKDKTILVTGAAGSIGSEIVRQVLRFNPKE